MHDIITSTKKEIPSLDRILDEALEHLNPDTKEIKNEFSKVLVAVDNVATDIFRGYEKRALISLAKKWLESQKGEVKERLERIISVKGWENFIEEASKLFVEFGVLVQELEKIMGNMRKARGGKTFEKMIYKLLKLSDISCEIPGRKAKEGLGRIDLVVPSVETALNTPDRAFFLTCKRTLRERWKQEVPQARLNQRIYLITIDSELSESKAKEINEKGFIAFVPDEVKKRKELMDMHWIRCLSNLPGELKFYETNQSL